MWGTQKKIINYEENILDTGEQTEFTIIDEITATKEPYAKLWSCAFQFFSSNTKWMDGPISDADFESIEEEVNIALVCKYTNMYVHLI